MSSKKCTRGSKCYLTVNNFSRTGNAFDCWNTKADGTGTDYADGAGVTNLAGAGGSITLYAIWNSNDKQIPQCDVKIGTTSYTYNGSEKIPSITVRDGHYLLQQGTDYTLSYQNNVNAGTASVVVAGKGNYSSSKTLNYTINKAKQTVTASIDAEYINVGDSISINVSGIGALSYTSSDPSIAEVSSDGVITGKGKGGTAAITVTAAGNHNYNSAQTTVTIVIYTNYGPEAAGPDIQWTLENGILRLTGSGEMFDWPRAERDLSIDNAPWYEQRGSVSSIIISDRITSIGKNAFKGIAGITEITIPDNVTSIGEYAFEGCSGLQAMTLPFVGAIREAASGSGIFGYIFGTSSVTGMTGVKQYYSSYGYTTRYLPSGLRRVTITGTSRIPDRAFNYCSMLTEISLPLSLTSIGERAFNNCSGITMVNIPAGVTSIGERTFNNCSGITTVNIPSSVTSIGSYAFEGCSGLTGVYITDLAAWCGITFGASTSNPVYYAKNLYLNGNLITNLNIPADVQAINSYAFYNGTNITGISIPNSVTLIGEYVFSGCSGITEITIPDSVTSIGEYAFNGCLGITEITIPDSVTSIGQYAFGGCSGLQAMTLPFVGASREATSSSGILGYIFGTSSVTGMTGVQQYYATSSSTTRYLPSGLRRVTITGTSRIPDRVFYNCSMLTEINLPASLTSIGVRTFYCCSGIITVNIPSSVTSIGSYAFYGCSGIATLNIPASVTSIGSDAFYGCSGIAAVNIPSSVKSIGDEAFNGCSGLTGVYITDLEAWCGITFGTSTSNPVYCAKKLYLNGNLITNLNIPAGVQAINSYAFYNGTNITGISIPNSVTLIGEYAFAGCSGITEITISDSVISIGQSAFMSCTGITEITVPDSVTSIGEYAFAGCSGLQAMTLPFVGASPEATSRSGIFGYIFGPVSITGMTGVQQKYDSSSSTTRYLPSGLRRVTITGTNRIPDYAFYGCTMINSINLESLVDSLGSNCFYGCTLTVLAPSIMDPSLAEQYGGTSITWNYFNAVSILDACIGMIPDQFYRYPAAEPEVSVLYNDTVLVKGKDYSVIYQNNRAVGNAGVTVKGIGSYVGKLTAAFTILPQPLTDHAVIRDIPNQEYNGSPLDNLIKITSDDYELDPKIDFSTVYRTDVSGNAEILITGKGNYTGTVTKTYKINYSDVFVLPDISSIEAESFSGSGVEYVVIPDSCTAIGSRAFSNCDKLFRIWISGAVTTIADDAFSENNKDLTIIAPSGSKAHEFALAKGYRYEEAVVNGAANQDDLRINRYYLPGENQTRD